MLYISHQAHQFHLPIPHGIIHINNILRYWKCNFLLFTFRDSSRIIKLVYTPNMQAYWMYKLLPKCGNYHISCVINAWYCRRSRIFIAIVYLSIYTLNVNTFTQAATCRNIWNYENTSVCARSLANVTIKKIYTIYIGTTFPCGGTRRNGYTPSGCDNFSLLNFFARSIRSIRFVYIVYSCRCR